ncbi:hypothetical protein EDD15DRAFT_716779 [Pisolithus albus]|nr:hypothetical protein EDD15DRAFT_716779 [Pisolithus albus]
MENDIKADQGLTTRPAQTKYSPPLPYIRRIAFPNYHISQCRRRCYRPTCQSFLYSLDRASSMGIDVLCAPQRSPLHIRHRSSCRSTGGLSWRGCHPANFTAAGWSLIMFVVSSSPEKLTGVFGNDKTMFKCQWVESMFPGTCCRESTTRAAGRCLIMFVVSSSPRIVLCAPQRSSCHRHRSVILILVQFAGLPPNKKYYRCGWAVLDNVCGVLVPGES